MKQLNVKDEEKVKELFLNSFFKECQSGWWKNLIILNENVLSFVIYDGDDLCNIIFDKSKNELIGDTDLIDESKINSLKSNLIEIIDQNIKAEQAEMKRKTDCRRKAGLEMATSKKIKTLSVADVDKK